MRQAITTKYLGPSARRNSRIQATATAGVVTVAYDQGLSPEANHTAAAAALAQKFDWPGRWYGGGLPHDKGNVYVCVPLGTVDGAAFIIS